jgi:hypothetical protein
MSLHGLSECLQTESWASLKLGLDEIPCVKERVTEIARSLGSVVVGLPTLEIVRASGTGRQDRPAIWDMPVE